MVKKDLISVIMPTHNGSNLISKAIQSVLHQTHKNLECIIIDDNGLGTIEQRETEKIIKSTLRNDNLKYIPHKSNKGAANARNTGLKASKGDYIFFLDDDDTIPSNCLEKHFLTLSNLNDEWGMSYAGRKTFQHNKLVNKTEAKKSGYLLKEYLFGKLFLGNGAVLIRKSVIEDIGKQNQNLQRHQDIEYFTRILLQYKIIAIKKNYFNRNLVQRFQLDDTKKYEILMHEFLDAIGQIGIPSALYKKTVKHRKMTIFAKYINAREIKNGVNYFRNNQLGFSGMVYFFGFTFKYLLNKLRNKTKH